MGLKDLIDAFAEHAGRLKGRDYKSLWDAYSAANKRGRIPPLDVVAHEIKTKFKEAIAAYALGDDPTEVFEESVRKAMDHIRTLIAEAHGQEYADDLWERLWSSDE
jgi:hypothetical protein